MFKLVLFGTLMGLVVGQMNLQHMMMMQMMPNFGGASSSSNSNSGQGASSGNSNSGTGSATDFSNALLCRNTANLVFVPCGQYKGICDMISLRSYQMPNLLKCSALGIGCCIKDMATMMLVRNLNVS